MAVQQPAVEGSSPMKSWGLATATENRIPSNGNKLLVTPIQQTPLMAGELSSQVTTSNATVLDSTGATVQTTLKSGSAVEAMWWPHDTRVMDAPMIRRGETVELYRYADSNKWYWREMGMDTGKRRGDRYRIGISANANNDRGANGTLDDNYVLDINGPGGMVSLTTSESNGEAAGYALNVDTCNGRILLGDNIGNNFSLDTKNQILTVVNSAGTQMQINLRNMTLLGQETITVEFQDMINTILNTINTTVGQTLAQTAGQSITLTAPDIFLQGHVHLQGPLTQENNAIGTACSFIGDTNWTGNMIAQGTWTINGVVVDQHTHNVPDGVSQKPNPGS